MLDSCAGKNGSNAAMKSQVHQKMIASQQSDAQSIFFHSDLMYLYREMHFIAAININNMQDAHTHTAALPVATGF